MHIMFQTDWAAHMPHKKEIINNEPPRIEITLIMFYDFLAHIDMNKYIWQFVKQIEQFHLLFRQ